MLEIKSAAPSAHALRHKLAHTSSVVLPSFKLSEDVCAKPYLNDAGTLNVGLAVLASCGVGGYMGIVSSPLMQIFPFIILSVGVDGMFVLQSALDATSTDDCMEVRMGEAVRDGGMSVAISSCINFFAFMIGTSSCLPALSAFCSYAAIGILLNVLLQVCTAYLYILSPQFPSVVFHQVPVMTRGLESHPS